MAYPARNTLNNRPPKNNLSAGIILIIIGILFLLNRIPQTAALFPQWLFTWPSILIILGLFIGVKSGFRNFVWLILILIGTYALLYHNQFISLNLKPFLLPIGLILIGIAVMTKRSKACNQYRHRHHRYRHFNTPAEPVNNTDDYININSMFGNIERSVFSKDFKGGQINVLFGGTELNFSQADFEGVATLELSILFGGGEIIIPANWEVKNEISVIFGGTEDKRSSPPHQANEAPKTLILKGSVVFGGIEIKSY